MRIMLELLKKLCCLPLVSFGFSQRLPRLLIDVLVGQSQDAMP